MSTSFDFKGRGAVVTGAAQGIGRAVAERLLDGGAPVWLWDRDGETARATAAALSRRGTVRAVQVDITELGQVERAAAACAAQGSVDILVNNAGISGPNRPTWDYPPKNGRACSPSI